MSGTQKFLVHHVRGYKLHTDPICCISNDVKSQRAAVARHSGCVEIWSTADWFLEGVIPPSECGAVEAVAWCGGRLFAVNLNGYVMELDTRLLICKRKLALNGGAVFCIDVSGTCLVIGTIDGLVALVETCDEQLAADCLTLQRAFPRQKHGILAIASYTEQSTSEVKSRERGQSLPVWLIATGHADAVCLWDAHRAVLQRRIVFEREPARRASMRTRANCVRCLRFIDSSTLVTGDSTGTVAFWDVNFGTQLKAFRASRAEILSLAVAEQTTLSVYAGSAESRIVQFARVKSQAEAEAHEWVAGESLRGPHKRAVRALCALDGRAVLSGGLDGRLVAWRCGDPSRRRRGECETTTDGTVERMLQPAHHRAYVCLARQARVVMLQYPDRLELSRLAAATDASSDPQQLHKLARVEVGRSTRHESTRTVVRQVGNLIERVQVRNTEPPTIVCSALSDDAKWIVYARSNQKLTVLRFSPEQGEAGAPCLFTRVRRIEQALSVADHGLPAKYVSVLRIANADADSCYLFVGTRDGVLIRLKLTPREEDGQEDEDQALESAREVETCSLTLEPSGSHEPAAFGAEQPRGPAVLSVALSDNGTRLLVACSDHSLRLIDAVRLTQLGMLRHDSAGRRPTAFAFDQTGSDDAEHRTLVLYSDGVLTEFVWQPLTAADAHSTGLLVAMETKWGKRVSRKARKRSALFAKLLRPSACAYNASQNADSRIAVWSKASESDADAHAEPVVFYQTHDELVYFDKSRLYDLCGTSKKRQLESANQTPSDAKRCKLNEHNVLHVNRQYANVLFAKLIDASQQNDPKELVLVEGLGDLADELPPALASKKFGM